MNAITEKQSIESTQRSHGLRRLVRDKVLILLKELIHERKIDIDEKDVLKLASLFESQLLDKSYSLDLYSCTDTLHSRVRFIAMKLCKHVIRRRGCKSCTEKQKVALWHTALKEKVGAELYEEIKSVVKELRSVRSNAYALHTSNYDTNVLVGQRKCQTTRVLTSCCTSNLARRKSMVKEVRDVFFSTHILNCYNPSSTSCDVQEWHELVNVAKKNIEQYYSWKRQFARQQRENSC